MKGYIVLLIGLVSSVIFYECKSLASGANNLNAFTVAQDKELGDQVAGEIASKPTEYPILPEAGNQEIYNYIRGMKNIHRCSNIYKVIPPSKAGRKEASSINNTMPISRMSIIKKTCRS